MTPLEKALHEFATPKRIKQKGFLSMGLVITRAAQITDFPLNAEDFLSGSTGQVKGLGKTAVQKILKNHDIDRVLAEECGQKWPRFLNRSTVSLSYAA
ncbi:DUF4928 family protein [Pontiella sp.]|uniref:DUF4928 family protein n=1 Tax=Pontiella sp. TaxID=2837462 RepID=UPI00356A5918